ncbi:TIGR03086 family metal-binding protein [Streptomyces sp. TRM64462]|uniref:TIGR03086 family metal-binding protein n=1 Tax=Streptomyces sp. TRM64462 TaxID=2741726 RepID=UPI0015867351|nr:TIGR03086 family metal-binding protein [Streptomyces sp. TRM64462]
METSTDTNPGVIDLTPAARRVAELVRHVDDSALGRPTPCPDYAVRELLAHLAGLAVAFRDAARKALGPTTDTDPGEAEPVLPDDWRAALPRRLDELAASWRDPAAWTGMTRAGGIDLPGAVAGLIALDEVLIHGWDLARATSQDYAPTEPELRASHSLLAPAAQAPGDDGMFGPPVPVPAGAPLLDQVVGLSGRSPDWRPPPA